MCGITPRDCDWKVSRPPVNGSSLGVFVFVILLSLCLNNAEFAAVEYVMDLTVSSEEKNKVYIRASLQHMH